MKRSLWPDKIEIAVHFTMALCGGFFGVHAVLSRMGNLGQAQTTNLLKIVCSVFGQDMKALPSSAPITCGRP